MTKSDTVPDQRVLMNIDINKNIITHTCTITIVISVLKKRNVFTNILETDVYLSLHVYIIYDFIRMKKKEKECGLRTFDRDLTWFWVKRVSGKASLRNDVLVTL